MRKRKRGRIQRFEEKNRRNENMEYDEPGRRETRPKKEKKKVRINGSRLALTIFLVVMVLVLCMSVKSIFTLRAEQKALTEENNALLLEKESLQDELKNVSDKEYIEEQARIQLKLIKPGEILYILEDENQQKDNEKKDEKKN